MQNFSELVKIIRDEKASKEAKQYAKTNLYKMVSILLKKPDHDYTLLKYINNELETDEYYPSSANELVILIETGSIKYDIVSGRIY